jgi:hypothetical protein
MHIPVCRMERLLGNTKEHVVGFCWFHLQSRRSQTLNSTHRALLSHEGSIVFICGEIDLQWVLEERGGQ